MCIPGVVLCHFNIIISPESTYKAYLGALTATEDDIISGIKFIKGGEGAKLGYAAPFCSKDKSHRSFGFLFRMLQTG